MPPSRQPFLHDLVTVLAAPTQVLSARTGTIEADRSRAHGVLHADVRVLSRATVTIDDDPGEHIATRSEGRTATFTALLRHVGAALSRAADPQVRLDRVRTVEPGLVEERLRLTSVLRVPTAVDVTLTLASDLAPIEAIKVGRASEPRPFVDDPVDGVLGWSTRP